MKPVIKQHYCGMIVICLGVTLMITGCSGYELRRKFVRKNKKPEPVGPVIFQDELYNTPAPIEIYRQSFMFWESWHDELLKRLADDNRKKVLSCAQQSVINLEKMTSLLHDEQAEGLHEPITDLKAMIADVERLMTMTDAVTRYRSSLEKMYRMIRRDYHPTKMGEFLKGVSPETNL